MQSSFMPDQFAHARESQNDQKNLAVITLSITSRELSHRAVVISANAMNGQRES